MPRARHESADRSHASDFRKGRIAFVSSNSSWGGSEELWTAAAIALQRRGHEIAAAKLGIERPDRRANAMRAAGIPLYELRRLPLLSLSRTQSLAGNFPPIDYLTRLIRFRRFLSRTKPELAVLSQGGNLDGLFFAEQIRRAGIPYLLIAHKAAEMYWPTDQQLPRMQETYRNAQRIYFVSEHNLRLTEQQIGLPLPQAEVVRNPFLVPYDRPTVWPSLDNGLQLACVGRLFPREKGQDIVLRVLARPKWRSRPVTVRFCGGGDHTDALKHMARFLELDSVRFDGEIEDITQLWAQCHALVLPSHCEGLPLTVVEAMLCARVPIVTAVAGNPEVVRDGETGFLASAPTDDALDEALERTWQARHELKAMGGAAARAIRELVPEDPAGEFASEIERALLEQRRLER